MEKNKGFQRHESSDSHMEAVASYVTAPATVVGDIGDMLSERHALKVRYRSNADQTVAILKNALLRINLNIQRAWPVASVIMAQRRSQARKLE